VTQQYAVLTFLHTIGGAYILAGFFVLGISAWHLLRRNETVFFQKSFRLALAFTLICSLFEMAQGHLSAEKIKTSQPAKLAAMECQWQTAGSVPLNLIIWPDAANERNRIQALPIPRLLSYLAFHYWTAEIKGLKDFPPNERPPVLPTFLSFRLMVGLGFLFIAFCLLLWIKRKNIVEHPMLLKLLVWGIPLPYIACQLGWTLAEVGRQPWIVYGMMKTSDAVSTLSVAQVATTLIGFIVLYGLLGIADFYLLFKYARKGPQPMAAKLGGDSCCK
jgi:cytochrome d ubiquinol oxidase subunit I